MGQLIENVTTKVLWWLVGILATAIMLGTVFYLNFVAKAVDEIRSNIGSIKVAVVKLESSFLTREDVAEVIEAKSKWIREGPAVQLRITALEKRVDELYRKQKQRVNDE